MIYAAYGSNMSLFQMEHRCPTAKVIGTGIIPDYSLTFRGAEEEAHATIQRDRSYKKKHKGVPVVLWEISDIDEKNLDLYEGFPRYYYKDNIDVITSDGDKVKAMVYIMQKGHDVNINMPSEYYLSIIIDGYMDNGIDTTYLFERLDAVAHMCRGQQ